MQTTVEQISAERDFLLDRANAAGTCSFGAERWTGISSNALVTVAFGGENGALPSDCADLAACYRTVIRLPRHLISDAVLAQLRRGEDAVGINYPDELSAAREAAKWPGMEAFASRGGAAAGARAAAPSATA